MNYAGNAEAPKIFWHNGWTWKIVAILHICETLCPITAYYCFWGLILSMETVCSLSGCKWSHCWRCSSKRKWSCSQVNLPFCLLRIGPGHLYNVHYFYIWTESDWHIFRARYEDAKFFYQVDTSKRFSEFQNQLKGILFHVSFYVYYLLQIHVIQT